MSDQMKRWGSVFVALVLAGLACLGTPSEPEDASVFADPTETPEPAQLMPEPTRLEPTDAGDCEPPVPEILIGEPVTAEIVGVDQPPQDAVYFCVDIPGSVTGITFSVTGTSAAVDLYVGYPDLETVQNGGFTFWFDDEQGDGDRTVQVGPGLGDFVRAGPYYIEVVGQDFKESTAFTLTVETP